MIRMLGWYDTALCRVDTFMVNDYGTKLPISINTYNALENNS
jgi:hypothetical protein